MEEDKKMRVKALVDGEEKMIEIEANDEGYLVIDDGNTEIRIDIAYVEEILEMQEGER